MTIIKVPFDSGSLGKNKGCSEAPEAICSKIKDKIICDTVEVRPTNFSETHKNIQKKVEEKEKAIILGGDHSITYSSFKGTDCDSIIIFDAHPDLMHGTEIVTHEDFLLKLVEEGLDPSKIILIGVRKLDEFEIDFMREKQICFFTSEEINNNFEEFVEKLAEKIKRLDKIYLSIDIDVIDPQFAPGTGYTEEDGISPENFFKIAEKIFELKEIDFADIVEINPLLDKENKTVELGLEIIKFLKKSDL